MEKDFWRPQFLMGHFFRLYFFFGGKSWSACVVLRDHDAAFSRKIKVGKLAIDDDVSHLFFTGLFFVHFF